MLKKRKEKKRKKRTNVKSSIRIHPQNAGVSVNEIEIDILNFKIVLNVCDANVVRWQIKVWIVFIP